MCLCRSGTIRGLDFLRSQEFERLGVELHENTSEELLRAVQEMDARVAGRYGDPAGLRMMCERVKRIEQRGHNWRRHHRPDYPFYSIYLSGMHLSGEFQRLNPWFVEERFWE